MSREGWGPGMQHQIAEEERRDAYFADPETQAALSAVSEKMLDAQREQMQSAEVGPESPEGRAEIIAAAEDNTLDQVYTYDPATLEVTYRYQPETFADSQAYENLATLQQQLGRVESKTEQGQSVTEDDTAAIQEYYDATRAPGGTFPEAIDMAIQDSEPLLVDVPESDGYGEQPTPAAVANETELLSYSEPEVVDYVAERQALHDQVFAKVVHNDTLQDVDRAAAQELLRQYDAADTEGKQQVATQLEQLINLLGVALPDAGRVKVEAGNLLADVEIEIGSNHSPAVLQARKLREQVLDLVDNKPEATDPVDQLLADKLWQREINDLLEDLKKYSAHADAYAAAEDDGLGMSSVYKLQPNKAIELRKKLTLEDVSEEGSVAINASKVTGAQPAPAAQPQPAATPTPTPAPTPVQGSGALAEMLRAVGQDGLESGASDASFTGEISLEATQASQTPVETTPADRTNRRAEQVARKEEFAMKAKIDEVEAAGFGRLDRWLKDTPSQIEEMADEPFDKFEQLVAVSGKDFPRYVMEHHPKLELRYPVLQEWADRIKDLRMTAQRMPAAQQTTKAVVEQYFKNKN